ncbi:MAG: hypothetical protein Q8942_03080, partial [Bacillota bacterium]|nr:hypothetical protein [Bacillota bacterium]
MKGNKKAYKKSETKNILHDRITLAVILFVVAIIPIIVRLKVIEYPQNSGQMIYDFFAYWKSIGLYIAAFISIILILLNLKKGNIIFCRENKIFLILSGLYLIMCLFSAIMSEHKTTAILGYQGQSEGLLTIAAVFVIASLAALYNKNNIKRDLIFKFLYISSIIIFIIGIFQFLGHDPFKAEIIKKLIIPKQY